MSREAGSETASSASAPEPQRQKGEGDEGAEAGTPGRTPIEGTADAVVELYRLRDTFFPRDPAEKAAALRARADAALAVLDSVPPEQRKSSQQRAVYEFLRGKILDVFPDYHKEAEDHLSKAVCSTEKYSIKPPIFDGIDYPFWRSRMEFYIQAQGYAIWRKVKTRYVVPTDENINVVNIPDVEANAKARNIIFQGLSRSEFNRISHLSSAYDIWMALDAYHEGTTQIKTVRQDQYKRDYNKFEMLAGESLDECFARFHKILSNLRAVGLTYPDSDNARQMLSALDLCVWEMKVTTIKDTTDLSTLTLGALYSRLKTHEIDIVSRKSKFQSMTLVTDPNPVSGSSSNVVFGFSLAALCELDDDQLEQLPENQLALLARKFSYAYKRVRDKKRGGPVICFECGGFNHIRANCCKLEKDKNDYGGVSKNDYTNKNRNKKPPAHVQGKEKKYRNFDKTKKLFHRVLTTFDDINFSDMKGWSDDDDKDDQDKDTKGGDDFIGICFMANEDDVSDSSYTATPMRTLRLSRGEAWDGRTRHRRC